MDIEKIASEFAQRPAKKITERAARNYTLVLHSLTVPVKSYKLADEDKISTTTLHSVCSTKLKQGKMQCPTCDKAVGEDEQIKAVEVSTGVYVPVTKEELEACYTQDDSAIIVTGFISEDQIDPLFFESSCYIGPGDGGNEALNLLLVGMIDTNTAAVVTVRKGGKQAHAILRPFKDGIVMHYLYYNYEVRAFSKGCTGHVNKGDLTIMKSLIGNMTSSLPLANKYDAYATNCRRMIAAKLRKEPVSVMIQYDQHPVTVANIHASLKESLKKARAAKA